MSGIGIKLENIGCKIDGSFIFRNLTTGLLAEGVSVILGPNGAGKSLLLSILHGMRQADEGRVHWIGALKASRPSKRAIMLQNTTLLRRSVRENITFAARSRGMRLPRAAFDAALDEARLSAFADQPAALLSGGEVQRMALARALITAPEVLFLDEPANNLDPQSTEMMENQIRRCKSSGIKVIMVTHHLGQAQRLADEVLFLHAGQIEAHQSCRGFFTRPSSHAAEAFIREYRGSSI